MYVRASHSPTTWQISRGPSCAPAVKKPPRGALGNTERLHSTQARCFSSLGLWSFTWISNVPTRTQPSKKRTPNPDTLKAKKLPKDATKKSFKRSAVLSADRFPPLTLEHHCGRQDGDELPVVKKKVPRWEARYGCFLPIGIFMFLAFFAAVFHIQPVTLPFFTPRK